jgi:hypothetical protein
MVVWPFPSTCEEDLKGQTGGVGGPLILLGLRNKLEGQGGLKEKRA